MTTFREVLFETRLNDMSFDGYSFTWDNGRSSDAFIGEHLDIVLVTNAWCDLLPHATSNHLLYTSSDHPPIVLNVVRVLPRGYG